MKTAYYVATTVRAYRMAIDAYYKDPENWELFEFFPGLSRKNPVEKSL